MNLPLNEEGASPACPQRSDGWHQVAKPAMVWASWEEEQVVAWKKANTVNSSPSVPKEIVQVVARTPLMGSFRSNCVPLKKG